MQAQKGLSFLQVILVLGVLAAAFALALQFREPELPVAQQQLAAEFSALAEDYETAQASGNAMAQAAVEQRVMAAKAVATRQAQDWRAQVRKVRADDDDVTVEVRRDGLTFHLILADPAVRSQLAGVVKGDDVVFDGALRPERSLTIEGALREPEFDVYPTRLVVGDRVIAQAQAAIDAQSVEAVEARCRADLGCWSDRQLSVASQACVKAIEAQARYTVRWTDGLLESKFPKRAWGDEKGDELLYSGDALELQNGFGAWERAMYRCGWDSETQQVTESLVVLI